MNNNFVHLIQRNKGELIYLVAQYSTPIISFLVNILIMRYVGPEILGTYQSIILWGTYLTFLQLGVFNGLNRNLAYYKGANQTDKYNKAVSTGFVFSLSVALCSLVVVFFNFLSPINEHSVISLWAFALLFITAFTQPLTTFFDTLYRTGQDFKKLGKFIAIDNTFFAINSVLIVFLGYFGYVIQHVIKSVLSLILRGWHKAKHLRFTFSLSSFKEQLSTGFLIMLNGYLYTTFFVFDQFYIVQNFDNIELGYYNLARLVLMIIPIIPNSLTTVLYPKASTAYGMHNNNKSVLKPFFKKALFINSLVVLPIIILVYIAIPPLVHYFLPEYVNGIHYAQISVWGGLGYIMVGPSVVMGVLKKNKINFLALGLLSICSYGLYFFKFINFDNIDTLIWYKNILFIGYSIFLLAYIYFILLKKNDTT
jgi:O-antigen/teichoic acid export membrane protein